MKKWANLLKDNLSPLLGGEEIPPGGWRGGEEIPPGGWRFLNK